MKTYFTLAAFTFILSIAGGVVVMADPSEEDNHNGGGMMKARRLVNNARARTPESMISLPPGTLVTITNPGVSTTNLVAPKSVSRLRLRGRQSRKWVTPPPPVLG
mmetsp:Transcript_23030/g.38066  ORF Transcript_23030/g.38066 Transcript_23030/m.38066 type:complete len:105 (-) Transcript_23030:49-363(-)